MVKLTSTHRRPLYSHTKVIPETDLPIRKILIANNGMSAIKFIYSLTDFSYTFYKKQVFKFYGLVTKEDIECGYEYVDHLDDFEVVLQYDLATIIRASLNFDADALFPGWGYESENPKLPLYLKRVNPKCKFIGPECWSMYVLGNKIISTLLCEQLGIPVIPWCKPESLDYNSLRTKIKDLKKLDGKSKWINFPEFKNYNMDEHDIQEHAEYKEKVADVDKYIQNCLSSVNYAEFTSKKQFPLIYKSADLGGGRGIHVIRSPEDLKVLKTAGGFLSKFIEHTRHVEIQLGADMYGNVIFLGARDCTTQRRNQKLIEETTMAPKYMIKDAIKIIRATKYSSLATVEFISTNDKYYFLEVNTRMQVEHPVSEIQCNINIPAFLYLVSCGFCIKCSEEVLGIRCRRKFIRSVKANSQVVEDEGEKQNRCICAPWTTMKPEGKMKVVDSGLSSSIMCDVGFSKDKKDFVSWKRPQDTKTPSNNKFKPSNSIVSSSRPYLSIPKCFRKDYSYRRHVIGLRVVSETSKFQPSTGHVTVSQPYMRNILSYFSLTNGTVSTSVDSQIGHIFSEGKSRRDSISQLIKYLRLVKIRGIETPMAFYLKYLSCDEFCLGIHNSSTMQRIITGKEYGRSNVNFESISGEDVGTWGIEKPVDVCNSDDEPAKEKVSVTELSKKDKEQTEETFVTGLSDNKDESLNENRNKNVIDRIETKAEVQLISEGNMDKKPYKEVDTSRVAKELKHLLSNPYKYIDKEDKNQLAMVPKQAIYSPCKEVDKRDHELIIVAFTLILHHQKITKGFVYDGNMYSPSVYITSPVDCMIDLNGSQATVSYKFVETRIVLSYDKISYVIDYSYKDKNMRLEYKGIHSAYVYDGSYIVSSQNGRITRINRECNNPGDLAYEIELMKVSTIIRAKEEGKLVFLVKEGDLVTEGQWIAKIIGRTGIPASSIKLTGQVNTHNLLVFYGYEVPDKLCFVPYSIIDMWVMLCIYFKSQDKFPKTLSELDSFLKVDLKELDDHVVSMSESKYDKKAFYSLHGLGLPSDSYRAQFNYGASTQYQVQECDCGKNNKIIRLLDMKIVLSRTGSHKLAQKIISKLNDRLNDEISKMYTLHLAKTERGRCKIQELEIYEDLSVEVIYRVLEYILANMKYVNVTDLFFTARKWYVEHSFLYDKLCDQFYTPIYYGNFYSNTKFLDNIPNRNSYTINQREPTESTEIQAHGMNWRFSCQRIDPYVFGDGVVYFSSSLYIYKVSSGLKALMFGFSESSCRIIKILYDKYKCDYSIGNLYVDDETKFNGISFYTAQLREYLKELNIFSPNKDMLPCLSCLHEERMKMNAFEREYGGPNEVFPSRNKLIPGVISREDLISGVCSGEYIVSSNCLPKREYHTCKPYFLVEPPNYNLQTKIMCWRNILEVYNKNIDEYTISSSLISPSSLPSMKLKNTLPPIYNENLQKRRNIAMKNNTMIPEDFIRLVKELETFSTVIEYNLHKMETSDDRIKQGLNRPSMEDFTNYYIDTTPSRLKVGVKVYLLTYAISREYLMSRDRSENQNEEVVFIVNDISHMNGSFSFLEYVMFKLATDMCLKSKLPRIFVSNNSGARVGICYDIMDDIFSRSCNPNTEKVISNKSSGASSKCISSKTGFKEDTKECPRPFGLGTPQEGVTVTKDIEAKYKSKALFNDRKIIAIYDNLETGPENLSFSARVASQTVEAFEKIFTLSYVSGLSVDIGAYLNRLGRRIIQKKTAPIILTGTRVLNKLTGCNMKLTNLGVGGPDVLEENGTVHKVVESDIDGIFQIFRWLNFYFCSAIQKRKKNTSFLRRKEVLLDASESSIFLKGKLGDYPKDFLKKIHFDGGERYNEAEVLSWILDQGSMEEYYCKWAPNVMVARGCVDGVSIGIVASIDPKSNHKDKANCHIVTSGGESADISHSQSNESENNRTARRSRESENTCANKQVGKDGSNEEQSKVWIPNVMQTETAAKIAQAIEDFSREGLDILILANWKGFCAGKDDMIREVIKNGAKIVEALSTTRSRVLIYLMPNGQLRGGTWVVFDKQISEKITFISHVSGEIGILQPSGLAELKIKKDWDKGEEYCRAHDSIYRMWARGLIDDLVSVRELKAYIKMWLAQN